MAALSEDGTRRIRQHVLNTLVQGVRRKRVEEYTRYRKITMDPRSIGRPKEEETPTEERDDPLLPFTDGLEVTRRLVDEHGDQDAKYPLDSHSSSVLSKTLENTGELTLASIAAARALLPLGRIRKPEKNKLLFLKMPLMPRGRSDRLLVSERSLQSLGQLSDHVRTLMAESTDKAVALDRLREIGLTIDSILSLFHDPTHDDDSIARLLRDFNHVASRYATDNYASGLGDLLQVATPTNAKADVRTVNSHKSSRSAELVDFIQLRTSPLEEAFTGALPSSATNPLLTHPKTAQLPQHGLLTFTEWAKMENLDSMISQRVGPVISTSLYRVTKGLIRHEFAIIAFHNGHAPVSWLRIERTARIKNGWLNSDSLGPVFSGVDARDLVSFSSSKEALLGNDVDQVAEVSIQMDPTVMHLGMYLDELAENLVSVSGHYPQYALLASNCRYFARRVILNFAQRLGKIQNLQARSSMKLGHSDVSYSKLARKIQEERFGGSQLVGEKGVLSQAESILGLAHNHALLSRDTEALQFCEEAVALLESLPESDNTARALMGRCYVLTCESLRKLHRFEGAYAAGQKACDLLKSCLNDDVIGHASEADGLARALDQCSQSAAWLKLKEDAIRCSQEGIAIRRQLLLDWERRAEHDHRLGYHQYHLGFALTGLSFYLSEARRKAEAVATGEEGIQILRALYNKRADIFGDGLAGSLHNYSIVLALASQKDEAFKAATEAVDLRRQATVMPERRLDLLALALYTYALRAAALEQWDDCLEAGRESLTHYRALNALRPHLFDSEIIRGLQTYSKHLQKQKRPTEALAARREHVEAVRSSFKKDPKKHRPSLARALRYLGVYAAALGLWEETIQADEESLSHYQILAEEDEEKYSDDVIHSHRMLSHHLLKCKRPDKAIHNKQQQIVGLRKAFSKDPDSRRADLALALYNLAIDMASNNRWDEAAVADKEALEHYRVLTKSDPKQYREDLTDTLFNYGYHAGKADRMQESLMAHRRHVATMRQRFDRMPETNRLDFAEGLYHLSYQAASMGLWKEALTADKQSLRLYRELWKHDPKKYASDLVDALGESAEHLGGAGQHQQALEFRQEQLTLLRPLAINKPKKYRPDLAYALWGLGVNLGNLKKWDEAIEADNESLETYKSLAQEDPDEYDPCVAEGFDYLADHLSDAGRLQEAMDVRKQGVAIARANFAKDPAANLTDLAPAIYNLGEDYANLELYTEAIQADKEALQLYRDLEKVNPTTHTPNVMDAVENCGLHLKSLQRYEEAIPYFREQVDLARSLFAKNPDSHREHLAEALYHVADDAKYLELWDESIAAAEESLALYRILAEDHPKKYLGDIIEGLESLAQPLRGAGRRQEALVHWREEISCLRTALANEDSDEDRSHLANVLHNLADDAAAEQLFEECIKAEGESVAIYRELAKDDPEAYNSKVILGLCFVARHLFKAQHLADADTAAKEVLAYSSIISVSSPSTTRDQFVGVLRECAALLEDNFTLEADELRVKAAEISASEGKDGDNYEGDGSNGS